MKTTKSESPVIKKKARKTWRKETRINDFTNSVNVEELDNGGYLVSLNKYGTNKAGKYIDETSKYYSEANPLEPEVEEMDELSDKLMNGNKSLLTQ